MSVARNKIHLMSDSIIVSQEQIEAAGFIVGYCAPDSREVRNTCNAHPDTLTAFEHRNLA